MFPSLMLATLNQMAYGLPEFDRIEFDSNQEVIDKGFEFVQLNKDGIGCSGGYLTPVGTDFQSGHSGYIHATFQGDFALSTRFLFDVKDWENATVSMLDESTGDGVVFATGVTGTGTPTTIKTYTGGGVENSSVTLSPTLNVHIIIDLISIGGTYSIKVRSDTGVLIEENSVILGDLPIQIKLQLTGHSAIDYKFDWLSPYINLEVGDVFMAKAINVVHPAAYPYWGTGYIDLAQITGKGQIRVKFNAWSYGTGNSSGALLQTPGLSRIHIFRNGVSIASYGLTYGSSPYTRIEVLVNQVLDVQPGDILKWQYGAVIVFYDTSGTVNDRITGNKGTAWWGSYNNNEIHFFNSDGNDSGITIL